MTYSTRPPVNPRLVLVGLDEVDGALRQYFRSAMPEPWPAAPRVAEEKTTPEPRRLTLVRFFRVPVRLAVAACVALLVIGYLALQSWFPDPQPVTGPQVDSPAIGLRPLSPGHSLDRTKSGRPVGVEVQPASKAKSQIIVIEELPAKK